jgi:FkbM family methyltransferase
MSKTLAGALAAVVRGGTAWMKPYRRNITRALVSERLAPELTVATAGGTIRFYTPTARSLHDPSKIFSDEPETIRWLNGLPKDDILWDIGANVGVFTLYAARARGLRVVAVEPSASSYAVLVRNIEINRLDGRVDAYCLAFDETRRLDYLHMAATEAGHSMHAFGQTRSVLGEIPVVFRQAVLGISVDEFRTLFAPPPPRHIKLDVDSIELEILRGAAQTLQTEVETVLVEVDGTDRAATGDSIRGFLQSLGFAEDAEFMAKGARRNVLFRRGAGRA